MCGRESSAPGTQAAQRGLSIIELMVGMVVALLVGLAATGAALSFSATQRQGIGAGGVTVNVTTALASIKNDLSSGGLGFFGDSVNLCSALQLSNAAAVLADNTSFVPVRITRELPHDRIDVLFGSRVEGGAKVQLRGASDGNTALLDSFLPVQVGDAVLMTPVPGAAATPCLVRSVTAVAAATATTPQTLSFANAGTHNQAAFTLAPAFAERARVGVLGTLNWSRYRVTGGNLVLERPLTGATGVIARNVMAFRVQYGVSAAAANSTALESWEDAEGGWAALSAANIPRVRALRIGVLVRSPQREKPDALGFCESTRTKPVLFGDVVEPDVADWECYRYRTAMVVVPLRNLVMGMRPI